MVEVAAVHDQEEAMPAMLHVPSPPLSGSEVAGIEEKR